VFRVMGMQSRPTGLRALPWVTVVSSQMPEVFSEAAGALWTEALHRKTFNKFCCYVAKLWGLFDLSVYNLSLDSL